MAAKKIHSPAQQQTRLDLQPRWDCPTSIYRLLLRLACRVCSVRFWTKDFLVVTYTSSSGGRLPNHKIEERWLSETLSAAKRGNSNLSVYRRKNLQRFRVRFVKGDSILKSDFDELNWLSQIIWYVFGAFALTVEDPQLGGFINVEILSFENFVTVIGLAYRSSIDFLVVFTPLRLQITSREDLLNRWSDHSVTPFRFRAFHFILINL